jgi:hypothetical protein
MRFSATRPIKMPFSGHFILGEKATALAGQCRLERGNIVFGFGEQGGDCFRIK